MKLKGYINNIYKRIKSKEDRLRKDVEIFKGKKNILDIGCGRGNFLKLVRDRAIGIDGSKDNVQYLGENGLNVLEVILPARLPFDDAQFDGVYCSHLIEHFPPCKAFKIIKEIDRVLRPGGILLIRSPLFTPAFFDDPTHVRPYHLHCVFHMLGGWQESGSRQMIFGSEKNIYKLQLYYEEIIPLYTSTVAPTIAPSRFAFRYFLRGMAHLMAMLFFGRKGSYGAILLKKPQNPEAICNT